MTHRNMSRGKAYAMQMRLQRAVSAPAAIRHAGALALFALCTTSLIVPELEPGLSFDRGRVLDGEWLRLAGGFVTHWSVGHFIANMLSLAVLSMLAGHRQPGLAHLLLAGVVSAAVLFLQLADLHTYRGSSPLVAVFLPYALATLWQDGSPPRRLAAALLGAGFALQTAVVASGAGLSGVLPAGMRSTWELHLVGVLCGCAGLLVHHAWGRARNLASKPSS